MIIYLDLCLWFSFERAQDDYLPLNYANVMVREQINGVGQSYTSNQLGLIWLWCDSSQFFAVIYFLCPLLLLQLVIQEL